MGAVRLLLAVSVVLEHIGHPLLRGVNGATAVQSFFVISGFYIALSLHRVYGSSTLTFWLNRALRLFPVYWAVAIATLMFQVTANTEFFSQFLSLPRNAQQLIVFSNIAIFGQDWVMFAGVRGDSIAFVGNFRDSNPELWTFLLSPPGWSLGVELTFYALAPFILRLKTPHILAMMAASLMLRIVLMALGFHKDPWSYRFFPTELAWFLLGGVMYRLYEWTSENQPKLMGRISPLSWGMLITVLLLHRALPVPNAFKAAIVVVTIAALIGPAFEFSKRNRTDAFLGDLSFPLYISHWLVLLIINRIAGPTLSALGALTVLGIALVAAAALSVVIDQPIQRLRKQLRGHPAIGFRRQLLKSGQTSA